MEKETAVETVDMNNPQIPICVRYDVVWLQDQFESGKPVDFRSVHPTKFHKKRNIDDVIMQAPNGELRINEFTYEIFLRKNGEHNLFKPTGIMLRYGGEYPLDAAVVPPSDKFPNKSLMYVEYPMGLQIGIIEIEDNDVVTFNYQGNIFPNNIDGTTYKIPEGV